MINIKLIELAGKIIDLIFPAGWNKRKRIKGIENEYKKKRKEIEEGISGEKDISAVTADILSDSEPKLPEDKKDSP